MVPQPDTMEILRLLVAVDAQKREKGQNPTFILMQQPGGMVGLKPTIGVRVVEPDIRELIASGDLEEVPQALSPGTLAKFFVTAQGRTNGAQRPVAVELDQEGRPMSRRPAPTPIRVLRWLAGWEDQAPGVLDTGGALANQIIADFGEEQIEVVCQRIVDLKDAGYLLFVDLGERLPNRPLSDRIGMGSEFRLTMTGRDRVEEHDGPMQNVTVIHAINAMNSQVAMGDITNFISFTEVLDAAQQQLHDLDDIPDAERAEAQGILDKLRSAGFDVATGAMGSGGGAVIGAILAHLLGLHT